MRLQHGTVIKKSGSWTGRYSRWVLNAAGEKIRQQKSFVIGSVSDMTKAVARRALATRIEQELGLRSDSRMTVQRFVETRWKPLRESGWRDGTKATNEWILSHIIKRFGSTGLEDCDAVALQLWLDQLAKTHSGSLVKHVRILLKSIFADAVDSDFLRKNPARLLRVPAKLKPVAKSFLTVEQIKALLSHAKGRDRIILKLFLVSGLRPSELFALRVRSLDVEQGLLNITESVYRGKVRPWTKTTDEASDKHLTQVFLPQEMVTELVAWITLDESHGSDFIFSVSTRNHPILKENWQQRNLTPIAKAAGIDHINYQMLRRSVATHSQGLGSAKDIQTMLRHTKPDTAQINYVQPVEVSVRAAVEKLAALLT